MKSYDLTNQKFGRLTALEQTRWYGQIHWKCLCDCGKVIILPTGSLSTGNTKSCGCLKRDLAGKHTIKHGLKHHPLYKLWKTIKQRCYNPNNKQYRYWGGRGIIVWEGWKNNPEAFVYWALRNGWSKGLQIDRINNNGNYEPSNCRFVTNTENSRNRRRPQVFKRKSGLPIGVRKIGSMYEARIFANGKRHHLGKYSTPEEARAVYDKFVLKENMD